MRCTTMTGLTLSAMLAVTFSLGCTSDTIVYRSGTNFAAPPAAAKDFVGYYDATNKQTVCGSCHVDIQTRWATTKHSNAWADLQANTSKATYCEACHTVGALGNASTDSTAGYGSVKDARYHDVQCESCHGAGLTHASGPTSSNRPLVSITADTGLKNGCGECHSGVHEPFLDEWKLSLHSKTHLATPTIATNTMCWQCHVAQGILPAWGINENYTEKTGANLPVVCAVCHDPHGSANPKQLRFSLNAATLGDNLCMKCHQRRAVPDTTGNSAAHSPEGPTLLGVAGWFPPGMNASDSLYGTHSSTDKNPTLCAGCHVQRFTVTDKATGKFTFQSTGHRFLATPCVDANGQPTVTQTCDVTTKTYRSCVNSSCHGTEAAARSAFTTDSVRIVTLYTELDRLLVLAKAKKPSDFGTTGTYSTGRGATFNSGLAKKPGSYVHNPFLIEQLLIASIAQVKKDYVVASPPGFDLRATIKRGALRSVGGGPR
jgi:predicted CXXCH cytochrome family protein